MARSAPHIPLDAIAARVTARERLTLDDCQALYTTKDLLALGEMANTVRERLNGHTTYFIVNRHLNYTNVCRNRCRFCAFSRRGDEPDAYALAVDEVVALALRSPEGITELHVVGGCHPELPYDYYLELVSRLHAALPHVHLQAFTVVEIAHMAGLAGLSTEQVLRDLIEAGLGSLPGGGAEVFSPRVRAAVCPEKLSGEEWCRVMGEAHSLGLRSNATMLYGHIETPEEKADHLLRLRALQDETGGFLAYIPLAYHSRHTRLGGRPSTTGFDDLREVAVGRLMLDNFPHVKSFWIMQGLKVAQVSLSFGADDLDGTVVQERITHAAGAETPEALTREDLEALILEAGRIPRERDTLYNVVPRPPAGA